MAGRGFRRSELPRLDLLRSFEAAARTLSFTRAAAELFLTQSAVSRQIQQIEADLGTTLFERRHRALALTDAGKLMQRAVRDCLERLRDATASVRASTSARQVAITTTPGFASLWLRFSQYSDVVAAAVAGQGVAIGRLPLLAELLRAGRLVAPFSGVASHRGYLVNMSPRAEGNPDARDFVRWLMAEAESVKAPDPAKHP